VEGASSLALLVVPKRWLVSCPTGRGSLCGGSCRHKGLPGRAWHGMEMNYLEIEYTASSIDMYRVLEVVVVKFR
jgi:hypothetical protein